MKSKRIITAKDKRFIKDIVYFHCKKNNFDDPEVRNDLYLMIKRNIPKFTKSDLNEFIKMYSDDKLRKRVRTSPHKGLKLEKKIPYSIRNVKKLCRYFFKEEKYKEGAFFMIQYDTSARCIDVVKMKYYQILDSSKKIKSEIFALERKTGNNNKSFKLSPTTIKLIELHMRKELEKRGSLDNDDYIFYGQGKISHTHMNKRTPWTWHKKYAKILNIDRQKLGTHSTRRTKPQFIWDKSEDIKIVMDQLRKKNVDDSLRYIFTKNKKEEKLVNDSLIDIKF